jgi:protein CpxP
MLCVARAAGVDDPVRRSGFAWVPTSSEFSPVEREIPMNHVNLRRAALAVAAVLIAVPRLAAAQPVSPAQTAPNPASPPAVSSTTPSPQPPMAQPSAAQPAVAQPAVALSPAAQAAVDQRIAALRSQLHITDTQAQPWNAFAQAMRDNAASTDVLFRQRASTAAKLSALDNMKSYAEVAHAYADNTEALATAFEGLYGVLSDQQKLTVDTLFREEATRTAAQQIRR